MPPPNGLPSGYSNLGPVNIGVNAHTQDQPIPSGPIQTASFARNSGALGDRARQAGHLPQDRFHGPHRNLNQLARHGGRHRPAHGHASATAGRSPQHLPPARPSQPRVSHSRPQPGLHMNMSIHQQRVPGNPMAGTRPVVHMTPAHRPAANSSQPTMSRQERHAGIQARLASARADLVSARAELAVAETERNPSRQQNLITSASTSFQRAESELRRLQTDPHASRSERLEASRLLRGADIRSLRNELAQAQFNTNLDAAVRDL